MSELKMSDVFDNPIEFELSDTGLVYCKYNQMSAEQLDYIESATLNHDRLVEENKELRAFLESLQLDVSNEIKLEQLLSKQAGDL